MYFTALADTLQQLEPSPLVSFVQACEGTLWLAGNGGSASIAQHWACDLSKAASLRAQALGANSALMTAWANDTHYAGALSEELARLSRPGDALICLSCSGRSPNIVRLLATARGLGLARALVTGNGDLHEHVVTVRIPHADYGVIEDCFSAIGHWLTRELCRVR